MRTPLLVVIGFAGLCVGFSSVLAVRFVNRARPPAERSATPDPQLVYRVELNESPRRGPDDALVTIVEFSGYDCRGCRALDDALRRLTAGPDAIRLVWKDLAGEDSAAARGARAAGEQDRFWELHDRLMSLSAPADDAAVLREAGRLGLDMNRFRSALQHASQGLLVDRADAQRLGLTTAPALFVNGRFVEGTLLDQLHGRIDEAKSFAMRLVSDGTPAEKVYSALMRGALVENLR